MSDVSSGSSRELGTLRRLHELMCRVNAGEDLQEVLQSLVDGVADVAGFAVAAVSILHPNQEFEMLAVAGDDDARNQLLGRRTPLSDFVSEFEVAENWGVLRFVPHERLQGDPTGWIPDLTPLDVPDAWHPEDALYAPLHAPTGGMVGMLSVDLPHDGRRPGQFSRDALDMYAVQAGIAISNAKQRDQTREEIRLGSVVRDVARSVSGSMTPEVVVEAALAPALVGLNCDAAWVRTLPDPTGNSLSTHAFALAQPAADEPHHDVVQLVTRIAQDTWAARQAAVVVGQRPVWDTGAVRDETGGTSLLHPELTRAEVALIQEQLEQDGLHAGLLVPIGAGADCTGYLLLAHATAEATWSSVLVEAALEIGREIGRALLRARVFDELRRLDRYKTEMFATVAHELKNPLTAITGHVELMDTADSTPRGLTPELARPSLAAINRATRRIVSLVDDLLVLASVGDPHRPLSRAVVDLRDVVLGALELFDAQATKQRIAIKVDGLAEPATVLGDVTELDRVVINLLSNAVKFTPAGSSVTVALECHKDVVALRCTDEGIGIAQTDQEQLFTEFFRSTNPAALKQPGTGLGLAIVKRVVERHGGTIAVESAPGHGATFTVTLPRTPSLAPSTAGAAPTHEPETALSD